ncbi:hypothetical protein FS842_011272 [Serendipita sp. 407]|nr:hypothetical protein FS842_011272 [Serendipita sp. 407]
MLFIPQWVYQSSTPATVDDEVQPETLDSRLKHYTANGERPPSSRIDPLLEQRASQPLGITDMWKYGVFLASKAAEVASDLVRHPFGARKKSWGIEMTILSALMRNVGNSTSLADLSTLRMMMGLSGLAPVPSDAIVTPVTFRARKRGLRGFLAESDAKETGSRVLSGEWIIGRRLWQQLQDEWRRAKVDENGKRARDKHHGRVILYLHGGAYYMFSSATHRTITIPLSKYTEARVFAVDYRLAPETRFPGQLHDAVLAYLRLIEDLHIPPENLIVCGDSAGGGLTMSLLLYLRDNNYPLPASAILLSPWVDLTMSCDSWDSNSQFDLVPIPLSGDHLNPILCFLGPEGMTKHLTHPYASPLFGDLKGLPPLLIQSGDAEVLRDEAMLLAHKATLAGVKVRHEIYEDQVHVFQMFFFLDATKKALHSCREFVNVILSSRAGSAPREIPKEAEEDLEREMGGNSARIVRGDGTIVEDKRPSDLSSSQGNSGRSTPDGSRTPSDVEPSWTQTADPRDGTEVDVDIDEPDSPISFKPRKRLPSSRNSSYSTTSQSTKAQREQTHSITKPNSTPAMSVPPNVLTDSNGVSRKLTRHRTFMNINATPSSGLLSPYVPSIRKRARATSHPDVSLLCQSWAERGPANESVRIEVELNNDR